MNEKIEINIPVYVQQAWSYKYYSISMSRCFCDRELQSRPRWYKYIRNYMYISYYYITLSEGYCRT